MCTSSNGEVWETMVTTQTDHSPMLLGLAFWGYLQYLLSAQLWWCSLSWSVSFLIGGQGCYAALFSLHPYLSKPGRYGPGTRRHHIRNHNKCWSLDDTCRSWDCLGGRRSDFDALRILTWRHPEMIVHYPITNSCPLGKKTEVPIHRLSHISSQVSAVPWLWVLLNFQTFCIRKELRCYLSKHQAETPWRNVLLWTSSVPPLPTFYWF